MYQWRSQRRVNRGDLCREQCWVAPATEAASWSDFALQLSGRGRRAGGEAGSGATFLQPGAFSPLPPSGLPLGGKALSFAGHLNTGCPSPLPSEPFPEARTIQR